MTGTLKLEHESVDCGFVREGLFPGTKRFNQSNGFSFSSQALSHSHEMSELSAVKARFKVRSQKDNEAVDWVDFKLLNIEKLVTLPISIHL